MKKKLKFQKKRFFIALIASAILSAGCSTVLEATHDGPIQQDPGKRSLGTFIDDQKIETITTVNINKAHPDLKAANINVNAFNGVVLLTGQVPNNELRLLAGRTAQQVQNVRQVYNEIQVRGNASFLAASSDTWLTTKVKSNLLANKEIDSGRIKVVTENGVVYLMGLLTRAEAEKAADVTRSIGGVQKVVKAVEYID
ncbi:BON domain-containing protein [Microbulbifer thermotolerans]|uniref:BON domain-containing protein n=1 Tax=Microbulbifer thermotolerans TaxID=252514 RepID=UPI000AC451D0|nr:BON domain-containing protein [Microbulbifer thermotolerans]MCX2830081.1 BON domain-containing protein [Microbulbifer thermotolerans]WKT61601.1 BON domain-containing protein [Microbulbifer thermotolerans]